MHHSFIRSGKTGNSLDEMSAEMIDRFDKWTAEKLRNSDLIAENFMK